MIRLGLLIAGGLSLLSANAQASAPLPAETIATIRETLPQCSGGWYETNNDWRLIGVADLAPRVELLARPSTELDDYASGHIYAIAKGLLVPALDPPAWFLDKGASLKCPARPAEAVALMQYLAGEEPDEWRGATNAFGWLALSQEKGLLGPPDAERARLSYLRWQIHSPFAPADAWSDGIDDDVIGNIERAGMRPYLEALARSERASGGARMILAEEALSRDPVAARGLLRVLDVPALNRLIALEDSGEIPTVADATDIAFWSEAWKTLMGYQKWASRLVKGVTLLNGGTVPTSQDRPSIAELRPFLDTERVADASATRGPMPVRALVDPQGNAIYVETCREAPIEQGVTVANLGVRLDAARLYMRDLPKLSPPRIEGRPVYGWVILPAVHFRRPQEDRLEITFAELPAEACAHSDMMGLRTIPAPARAQDR